LFTGANLAVSHGLHSCTSAIQTAVRSAYDACEVTLADTPGFDDTVKEPIDILRVIVDYLKDLREKGCTLKGVLYLHRISDPKMNGAAKRALDLFRALCGEDAMRNVIIVTTRWDRVNPGEGERRYNELQSSDFCYKPLLDQGAQMRRHSGTMESAESIIKELRFVTQPPVLCLWGS